MEEGNVTEFNLKNPPQIIFGSLAQGIAALDLIEGGALVLADASVSHGVEELRGVLESQGIQSILYSREGLSANTHFLSETLSLARGGHTQCIVGLGGDSVLSLARLTAAAVLGEDGAGSILRAGISPAPSLPVLEIPIFGRHSLLFHPQALMEDLEQKRVVYVPLSLEQRFVAMDSTLSVNRSERGALLSVAGNLAMAVEAYLAPGAGRLAMAHAQKAILGAKALLRSSSHSWESPEFREQELELALFSSLACGLTQDGPGMRLAWSVAAATGTHRASCYGVLLPWLLESPLYSSSPRCDELIPLLSDGLEDDLWEDPAEVVRELYGSKGLPGRLRDVGVDLQQARSAPAWALGMNSEERPDLDTVQFQSILDASS